MVAVRDDRVTVIRAALDEVELVAAGRTHLDIPVATLRVERKAARIPLAELPDSAGDVPAFPERTMLVELAAFLTIQNLAHVAFMSGDAAKCWRFPELIHRS